jgi:hypothetical protein
LPPSSASSTSTSPVSTPSPCSRTPTGDATCNAHPSPRRTLCGIREHTPSTPRGVRRDCQAHRGVTDGTPTAVDEVRLGNIERSARKLVDLRENLASR